MEFSKENLEIEKPPVLSITKKSVEAVLKGKNKKICFTHYQTKVPKLSPHLNKYFATINLPFSNVIKHFLEIDFFPNNHQTQNNPDAVWYGIETEGEYNKIKKWIIDQGPTVFIKDCLSLSIALSMTFESSDENRRTQISELKHQAKYDKNPTAIPPLVKHCTDRIQSLPYYKDAKLVCAVPHGRGKGFDLPSEIVKGISNELKLEDITHRFTFHGQKEPLKELAMNDKWDHLEAADLRFEGMDLKDKEVILIDDLYQSGTTLQFVAMKLQQAGVKRVYGLCLVKSWRDDDNQS